MIIAQIAACAENGIIGKNGDLPWDIPEDMAYFKKMTSKHIMIMGRKTFDSFQGRLLPQRFHIVISRSAPSTLPKDAEPLIFVTTFEEAIEVAKKLINQPTQWTFLWPNKVFVIGGGEIYRLSLEKTNLVYLTRIHKNYEGDSYFPVSSLDKFKKISEQQVDGNPSFTFEVYERV